MSRPRGPRKLLPPDFAECAKTMRLPELKARYRVCQEVIARWYTEIGGNPRAIMRQLPTDFASIAPAMSVMALQRHYGVGERVIKRWVDESGVQPHRRLEVMPADFAFHARNEGLLALATRYHISRDKARRWRTELGLPSRQILPREKATTPSRSTFSFRGHAQQPIHRDLRNYSPQDEAADILRRERFVVFRCDERGRYAEKGEAWRVGNVIVSPDELLRRADRYRSKAA